MPEVKEGTIQHQISAEGADPLLLSGVNDANLLELARVSGARVVLRGDQLLLSGTLEGIERVTPIARHMVDLARMGVVFSSHDISRFADAEGTAEGSLGRLGDGAGIAISGSRKVINPKSEGQRTYLEAIEKNDIVIGIGPAGTGKTYLAVAMAVDALHRKRVKRIILARPAVEAGENLGFLPGDLQEKVDPYLRPLYDALEDMMPAERVRRAIETRAIEIAPLAYMRGRTLHDAFVILDEAQNATTLQMKMFLTRLGLNSKAVITGDKTQIDLRHRRDSGLLQVEEVLKGIGGIEFVYMQPADVLRHRLVKEIIRAYGEAGEREEADSGGARG
ncbi:MAG: PhoH family protein [Gemmatimonadota bacterium]|jgi:phosphate starvation-inducible PhoH-like protein|nr:PhoH family protein [Gemmatimonadota bacterium]